MFGKKYNKDKFIEQIRQLPLNGIFDILSQLLFYEVKDKKINSKVTQYYKKYIDLLEPNNSYRAKIYMDSGNFFYSHQSLLNLWKWLLAYGDKSKLQQSIDFGKGIFGVIYFSQIIGDYESESAFNHVSYYMFQNALFNSSEDPLTLFGRALRIYTDIARDRSLFKEKEYVDFNTDFESFYGYSIKEYIAVLFAIMSHFLKSKSDPITTKWRTNFEKYFSESIISDKALKIVSSLSASFDEYSEWAKESVNKIWDFRLFQEKPLLLLPDGNYLPISKNYLLNQLFDGLFYKIQAAYSQKELKDKFHTFFGKPFEEYAKIITDEALKTANKKYKLIPEFEYGKHKDKRSPDIIIRLGDKLLVIEVKSRVVKRDSAMGNNPESMHKEIDMLDVNPIIQAAKSMSEILLANYDKRLSGIDEIYLMAVTRKTIPSNPDIESYVKEKIKEKLKEISNNKIKLFFHLDIEEYEYLCYLLSRKKGKLIFKILEKKTENGSQTSFKNFLFNNHIISKKGMRLVREKFNKQPAVKEIIGIILPKNLDHSEQHQA